MQSDNYDALAKPRQTFNWPRIASALPPEQLRLGIVAFVSVGIGLAVVISTYYVDNVKLLIGLLGGLVFVLLTMRWPEFGILSLVALLSGLISLTWLPLLHLGPISFHISDMMIFLLLGLVFLRATTQPDFTFFRSPLLLPLILFVGAFLLSAVNAVLIYGVSAGTVLGAVRVLGLWIVFIPTMQLVRTEEALRRLLMGLLMLTGILLIGVLIPNKLAPFLPIEVREVETDFARFYYAGDMILYTMVPVTVASLGIIKKENQLWRIGLLGLLLYWAFKTYYRQYWLTLFIICILLFGFLSSKERIRLFRRMVPAITAATLLVVVLMSTQPKRVEGMVNAFVDRVGSLGRNPLKEASLEWRVIESRYALIQISRHPVFGLGLANSYRPRMEAESEAMYSEWAYRFIENGYLYIALFMGLVGLIPFLWLCAVYLLRVLLYQYEIQDEGLRAIYLGYGAAFLGMVACNIATPTFVFGARLIFFPVALAIGEVILRLEREKRAQSMSFFRENRVTPSLNSTVKQEAR